jgi:hypothetical protein
VPLQSGDHKWQTRTGFNAQEAVTVITPERLRSIKRLLNGNQISDGRSAIRPERSKGAGLFMRKALSRRAMSKQRLQLPLTWFAAAMDHQSHSGERRFIVKRLLWQFIEQGRIKRDGQIKNLRQGIAGGFGG